MSKKSVIDRHVVTKIISTCDRICMGIILLAFIVSFMTQQPLQSFIFAFGLMIPTIYLTYRPEIGAHLIRKRYAKKVRADAYTIKDGTYQHAPLPPTENDEILSEDEVHAIMLVIRESRFSLADVFNVSQRKRVPPGED